MNLFMKPQKMDDLVGKHERQWVCSQTNLSPQISFLISKENQCITVLILLIEKPQKYDDQILVIIDC